MPAKEIPVAQVSSMVNSLALFLPEWNAGPRTTLVFTRGCTSTTNGLLDTRESSSHNELALKHQFYIYFLFIIARPQLSYT